MICENCIHYEVCANILKEQLLIREKVFGEKQIYRIWKGEIQRKTTPGWCPKEAKK